MYVRQVGFLQRGFFFQRRGKRVRGFNVYVLLKKTRAERRVLEFVFGDSTIIR